MVGKKGFHEFSEIFCSNNGPVEPGRWYMFTGCGTALVTPFRRRSVARRSDAAQAGAPADRSRASISWSPAAPPAKAPRSRAQSTCAWSRSRSKRPTGKVPVLAGAGGYNTHEVIELARELRAPGRRRHPLRHARTTTSPRRKASTSTTRPSPRPSACPIIVYSVQGRTGVNVEPATLARLAEIDNIVGVKEASGNIARWPT